MYNTVPLFVLIHSASPLITFWQMQQTGTGIFLLLFIFQPPLCSIFQLIQKPVDDRCCHRFFFYGRCWSLPFPHQACPMAFQDRTGIFYHIFPGIKLFIFHLVPPFDPELLRLAENGRYFRIFQRFIYQLLLKIYHLIKRDLLIWLDFCYPFPAKVPVKCLWIF